jgi:hypothetical protein
MPAVTGRHPWRPALIHSKMDAADISPDTRIYDGDGDQLDSNIAVGRDRPQQRTRPAVSWTPTEALTCGYNLGFLVTALACLVTAAITVLCLRGRRSSDLAVPLP